MGPIYSLDDFIDFVRRRAGLIVLVTFVGCVLSVWYALGRPHAYRASEVIQVAQPRISDDLAKSTVEGSAARRLQLIEQRLMARDNLLEVIGEFGLYSDLPGLRPSERVALLRNSVRIEGVAAAREGFSEDGSMSVVTVSARMPTPEQAQQVAHEFAQRTVQLSRDSRIAQARETLDFLKAREQGMAADIADLESEVVAFRQKHELTLPGSIEFRRSEIATLNEVLLGIERERIRLERASAQIDDTQRLATAERRRSDLAEQIKTVEAQRRLLLDRKSELEKSIETSPDIERALGAYERRLTRMRAQLDGISARRSEAEVGFRLEEERQSEHLTVIEPAELPDYPVTGSRKKIAVLGGGLSVLAAFAIAFAVELRNPVIRTAAQMQRETGIRPVVSVPVMDTAPRPRGLFGRRRRRRGGSNRSTA
ncbi:MAG: GumC family protein [Jhaorihella sp.]